MNRWRKRRDIFGESSSEDLADVNEQELAKDPIKRVSDSASAEERSECREEPRPIADPPCTVETYKPHKVEKKRFRRTRADSEAEGFGVFSELYEGGEELELGKREKRESQNVFYRTVITVSMLVSILIFAFVMLGAYFDATEPTDEDPEPLPESSGEVVREGDRVIYIRELDGDSGIMTAAEIYSKNVASVVTVVAGTKSSQSIGTGFVLSSDGYIATACHTLSGAEEITVVMQSGERIEAFVVGLDEVSDLALLRVFSDGLVGVETGNSDELVVGERIVAIGTPYSEEFFGSVFSGSVSSCSRTVSVYDDSTGKLEKKMNFVQLSATLGKGCSGCPVFDEYGRVIGVLSSRLGDGTSGVCFALPINGAMQVLESLKSGEVDKQAQNAVASPAPKLGVLGSSSSESVEGLEIIAFSDAECDAARKLRLGDVIVAIGSAEVKSFNDVFAAVGVCSAGESVAVTVYRAGQYLTFDVELTG